MGGVRRSAFGVAVTAVALLALAGPAQAAAPVNETSPTISGSHRVGQTLSASQGEWTGNPTAFFYQWLRCDSTASSCSPIAGAVDPTYQLSDADLGSRLRVEVVASNADGASPAKRSAATPVIKLPVPTLIDKPVVSGVPREGQTLSASTGSWTNSPTSFQFEWRRCAPGASACVEVPGASGQTYPLGSADVGTKLRVRVKAINAGGASKSAGSATTPTIKPAAAGFRLGHVSHDRRRGLARILVRAPEAGALTLARSRKVRGERRDIRAARTVKLAVRPRPRARRALRRRGKLRVRVAVTFAPSSGAPRTERRHLVLRSRR